MNIKKLSRLLVPIIKSKFLFQNDPYFVTLIVSWRCNAKCIMCDVWKKKPEDELDAQRLVNTMKKISNARIVRLTGGEPFLHSGMADIFNGIVQHTNAELIHITTNGILTSAITEFIKNVKHKNKIHIKISLNGVGENYDRIMGTPGAYKKVMRTLEQLKTLQVQHSFILGVNQTITDRQAYLDSREIRAICAEHDIPYLPVIAYEKVALYDQDSAGPKSSVKESYISFKPFGDFTEVELKAMLEDFMSDSSKISNVLERFVKQYYLRGLYNRIVLKKSKPHPKCVALRNHIRLMPNGDVLTCLHNTTVVGNLNHEPLKNIMQRPKTKAMRKWVVDCTGCWAGCEIIPSAIFSYDTIGPFLQSLYAPKKKEIVSSHTTIKPAQEVELTSKCH